MLEQLDRSIEKERKLLVDISELTEYSIHIESDNRKLRQERQQAKKAATMWRKRAKKAIFRANDQRAEALVTKEEIFDTQRLRCTLEAQEKFIERYKRQLKERVPLNDYRPLKCCHTKGRE